VESPVLVTYPFAFNRDRTAALAITTIRVRASRRLFCYMAGYSSLHLRVFMDWRAGAAFCGPGVQRLCWRTSRHDSRARIGRGHDGPDVRSGMDSMKRQDVLQRILTVSRGHESRTDIDIPSFSKVLPLNVPECPAMSLYLRRRLGQR
jgi:hypothetical protein